MILAKSLILNATLFIVLSDCTTTSGQELTARYDKNSETISVFRNSRELLLTQHVKSGVRPYIHPIMEHDGNGVLTEFSPAHHKHQTGLYWGLKKLNGRDYFMNWKEDYWQKVSAHAVKLRGSRVSWQSVYNLIDAQGNAVLTETQLWSIKETDGKYILDLEWRGDAKQHVTIEKFYVGGLFLRMPWHTGIDGEVINSEGKKNSEAELKRARWNDVGLAIDGRNDKGHIAILEHPSNVGFPNAWRVDNELGVGPSLQISGDWSIMKGASAVLKYRLIVYTGQYNHDTIARLWKEYAGN